MDPSVQLAQDYEIVFQLQYELQRTLTFSKPNLKHTYLVTHTA